MNILSNKKQALKGSPKLLENKVAFAVIDDREIIKHDLVKYIVETYTENTVYNFYKRKCDILGFYKEKDIDNAINNAYDQYKSNYCFNDNCYCVKCEQQRLEANKKELRSANDLKGTTKLF